ncbi:hypothetical protein BDQ94DRAFT_114854 [Aspergillus welwitschiae]|uniref:Uncharacterized protein n=1 Tax=Aspergillus welwitschiae TaxID=1341132 RepID=A0A3F3QBS9_9EURO|nr:hypothetical protein BDQ94DRAFT_114854 [Aspergillus welwitschiae]RDH36577.1 hypothetical protein BDQ94DRAFT_114854 [Aspergillus welwitschiae]
MPPPFLQSLTRDKTNIKHSFKLTRRRMSSSSSPVGLEHGARTWTSSFPLPHHQPSKIPPFYLSYLDTIDT